MYTGPVLSVSQSLCRPRSPVSLFSHEGFHCLRGKNYLWRSVRAQREKFHALAFATALAQTE
jgi:hypothetical protein